VLRDWREGDAPAVEPVCGEWDVCQFSTVPWDYTPSEARAWINRQHERRSTGSGLALAITRDVDGLPVGNVNLVRFSHDGCEAALGYWLIPVARGQGLAVRSAGMLCGWDFENCSSNGSSWRSFLATAPPMRSPKGWAPREKACGSTVTRPVTDSGTWSSTR
jgi:RimJ/RimL family protein N-acetyltransferase